MKLQQNLIESYNNKASERNSNRVQEWKIRERAVFLNFIKEASYSSLLEIGAGPGKDSLYFKEQGLDPFSTDLSPDMVKLCREKGLDAEVMDFAKLDFPDQHFDSVWAMNCLLHVPKADIREVLTEIKRVMKPSGLLYVGVYGGENSEGIWEEDFYSPKRFFSFFEDDSIKQLLSEFFTIEYFNIVPKEIVGGEFHLQSIVLRK